MVLKKNVDELVQLVLDSECDIENDISSDDLRAAVIDRIAERINNDELNCLAVSDKLYHEYSAIRDAMQKQALRLLNGSGYGIRKAVQTATSERRD